MPGINEISGQPTQLNGALLDGLATLDLNAQITFQAYSRVVLPVDGFVFWSPTTQLTVSGSLHYSQDVVQTEDETYGNATVVLTTGSQIVDFAASPATTIYVATAGDFRYAFSQQQGFYSQAGLWHYFGHSVQPAMAAQLLDSPGSIDFTRAVTSNSLALWLALGTYVCPYYDGFSNTLPLYPSFLTPPNLLPAYGAVHIDPSGTRALQAVRHLDGNRTHTQLVSDRVRITLYGLQSDEALDFVDCVLQYSLDQQTFGIMNMPVIRDGKRNQTELEAIAMQKFVDFEISYYQSRVNTIARQLILQAVPAFIIDPVPSPKPYTLNAQSGQQIDTQGGQALGSQSGPDLGSLASQSGAVQNTQNNQDIGFQ